MRQHLHPQMESRTEKAEQVIAPDSQILNEHGFNVFTTNPPAPQLVPISLLRQEWMTAKRLASRYHRFFERQVLERVQRVVMHERGDRSLRGQQVRRVFDQVVQTVEATLCFVRGSVPILFPQ